ncbi:MAG: 50S ribosomal protein L35 [Thermodesulfobacteriota bacterium]
MPKMKTHRGAAKRISVTGSGRLKRKRPNLRHILTSKSRKRKRHLRQPDYFAAADEKNMKQLLPYL